MQLSTRCCAHCHPLEEKEERELKSSLCKQIIAIAVNKREEEKSKRRYLQQLQHQLKRYYLLH